MFKVGTWRILTSRLLGILRLSRINFWWAVQDLNL